MIDTIKIITPCLKSKFSKSFNLAVSHDTKAVSHQSENFIISNKDGSVLDVEVDEKTLDLLIEAKQQRDRINNIIRFYENTPEADVSILKDANLLIDIAKSLPQKSKYINSYLKAMPMTYSRLKEYIRNQEKQYG